MFIIRFVTGSVIGVMIGLVGGILTLLIVLGVVLFFLVATGGPGDCTPGGGEIVVSAANAEAFDDKWEAFDDVLDSGSPSFVVLDESEITSRADQFIEEEAGQIDNVRICLHDGFGEATGSVDIIPGFEGRFKAAGTVDLTGDHPLVEFDDIDIGNIPGFAIEPLEGFLEDAIEELLDKIDLQHRYAPAISKGEVRVDGQP